MLDAYCTSEELAAARPEIAVLGVGAVEQHSHHLPVGTDWIGATEMSRRVAERLGAFWVPVLPFSMSQCHGAMSGTVWLRPETLAEVVRDVVLSLAQWGVRKVVLINCHGGNFMLEVALQELNLAYPSLQVILVPPFSLPAPGEVPVFETAGLEVHAGESETSSQLHLNGAHVKEERIDYVPPVGREFLDYAFMEQISPHGVWGVPSKATAAKGEQAALRQLEAAVAHVRKVFAVLDERKAPIRHGKGE